ARRPLWHHGRRQPASTWSPPCDRAWRRWAAAWGTPQGNRAAARGLSTAVPGIARAPEEARRRRQPTLTGGTPPHPTCHVRGSPRTATASGPAYRVAPMRRRGSEIVAATVLFAALALGACSSGSGAGAGNADGPDRATEASAPADCDPPRPAVASAASQTFRFGDEERAYLLALPDDYDGSTAYPLVFNFHGFAGSKEGHDANTVMADQGTARGYGVGTPDAPGEA